MEFNPHGQVLYTFGGYGIRQDKGTWKFQNVEAVAFPDINGDGFTDVITISNYKFGESMFSEARIYTGREGRYFIEESTLEEAYNNSHDQKTITDIQNFAAQAEYQDYFELEGVEDSASLFGQHFYQMDTDNVLIYYEGVFFRTVRE